MLKFKDIVFLLTVTVYEVIEVLWYSRWDAEWWCYDTLNECTDCPITCALPTVYVHSWILLPHQSSFRRDGLLPLLLNPLLHDTRRLTCHVWDIALTLWDSTKVCVCLVAGWMDECSLSSSTYPAHMSSVLHNNSGLVEAGCKIRVNEWAILFFGVFMCAAWYVRRWKWQSQTLQHSSMEAHFNTSCSPLPSDTSQLSTAVPL